MIGGMSLGSILSGGSARRLSATGSAVTGLRAVRRLAALLAVASAFVVTGCDAESQAPEPSGAGAGAELGRSASELDEAGEEAADDASDDEAPPSETEVLAPPGASSPLDPRAEPDPIPWVPRTDDTHDA